MNTLPKINTENTKLPQNIKLISYQKYCVTIHNKDYAMGYHYPEDDWDYTVYGSTEEELFANLAETYFFGVNGCIYPESWYFEIVTFYEVINAETGETIIKEQVNSEDLYNNYNDPEQRKQKSDVIQAFYASDAYKTQEQKYEKKKEARKKAEEKEREQEKIAKDKQQLKKLAEKYPEEASKLSNELK